MFSKQVEGQTLNYVKNNELSLSLNKTSILYFLNAYLTFETYNKHLTKRVNFTEGE